MGNLLEIFRSDTGEIERESIVEGKKKRNGANQKRSTSCSSHGDENGREKRREDEREMRLDLGIGFRSKNIHRETSVFIILRLFS